MTYAAAPGEQLMDALSDVCSLLNVKDIHAGQMQLEGCWAMRFADKANRCVTFGAALRGSCWLSVDGVSEPLHIQAGDCYLIGTDLCYSKSADPRIAPHSFQPFHEEDVEPLPFKLDVQSSLQDGSGDTVAGVRFFLDELHHNPLLDVLPPVIHVRGDSEIAPMLRSMLSALSYEASKPRLGAAVVIDHLARILFVQVLRTYLEHEEHPTGWLGALADARIGSALSIMHRDVGKHWTVDDLAEAVGMSRSSFALRFKMLVGQTPLDYWLQLRMRGAAQALCSSKTVSSVAFAWGYESEKSFSKAFKRVMGCPPSWYRRTHATAETHRLPSENIA